MFPSINPSQTAAWKKLDKLYHQYKDKSLKSYFEEDKERLSKLSIQVEDIFFDYSKNLVNADILATLLELAAECKLQDGIEALFSGEKINKTEDRAVLHMALRNRSNTPIYLEQINIMDDVNAVLDRMRRFVSEIHSGNRKGFHGKSIKTIVNIGIGGSDLGPMMACEALKYYWEEDMVPFFVSNVDGSQIFDVLQQIDLDETLFIIASKTFTTAETMANASTAKQYFLEKGFPEEAIRSHFVAVSTNQKAVTEFGIDPNNMFEFWDWVGGRFSMSSAIGLSIMCMIGAKHFNEMLEGMHRMDQEFRYKSADKNIAVILALISIWYNNFYGFDTEAILPYDQRLVYLPDYLQQAFMESNGKSTDRNGLSVDYQTESVIWGKPGTNGQHAFYQLIHQGTKIVPADFIVAATNHHPYKKHHEMLVANCFAQSEALMNGLSSSEVKADLKAEGKTDAEIELLLPYKVFPGNRPSSTFLLKELNPKTLGMLIALYEHKIFVKGLIWNIYSFDQWGVQLGKILAKHMLEDMRSKESTGHDGSTNALLAKYLKWYD